MDVTIRNFGYDNTKVHSVSELMEELKKHVGDSISIQYTKPSGIVATLFADISMCDDELLVADSYTSQFVTDFDYMFAYQSNKSVAGGKGLDDSSFTTRTLISRGKLRGNEGEGTVFKAGQDEDQILNTLNEVAGQ